MAIFAYFIFFLPLLTESKDDPFVKFHVKQSLVFFIAAVLTGAVQMALGYIPLLGGYINWVLTIGLIVLWIMGILNAAAGKEEKLPVIGKYADNFKI